jgi:uncharacterized protein involved in exopolysaccharide biosynthesis
MSENASRRLPGVRLVLRRWWWVALGLALGLGAGLGAGALRPPSFESTAVLTVSADEGATAGDTSRAAQALARLATQPGVVGEQLTIAGLRDAAEEPRRFVRVQAAPDAPIISVTGASPEAATAQELAEIVSEALVGLQPYPPFRATIVADAEVPPEPRTPSWTPVAGGAGLGTALALVLAATVPDAARRPDEDEVELQRS